MCLEGVTFTPLFAKSLTSRGPRFHDVTLCLALGHSPPGPLAGWAPFLVAAAPPPRRCTRSPYNGHRRAKATPTPIGTPTHSMGRERRLIAAASSLVANVASIGVACGPLEKNA